MPQSFLRIPPFPGNRAKAIARAGTTAIDPAELLALLRHERVGGAFWGSQPALPRGITRVLAPTSRAELAEMLSASQGVPVAILAPSGLAPPGGHAIIPPGCDPWHLARHAGEVWAAASHELALVSAITGTELRLFGSGEFADCNRDPAGAAMRVICRYSYANPFDGTLCTLAEIISQLGEWRRLIEGNKCFAGVWGAARWKRVSLDPMLWNGESGVRHFRNDIPSDKNTETCAVWKSRTAPSVLTRLERAGAQIAEIEDGFIRSIGLGANCVPPLSVIVDCSGIYFDPARKSDLESLIQHTDFDSALCQRASSLRARLVQASISKYAQGGAMVTRPEDGRRRVLVTGQVEDDRSIQCGGAGVTNLRLLQEARRLEGDAWLIYKPHPDVEAGHRKGHVPDVEALQLANEIARDAPILSLIDSVDALHCITSLAGFEALLRGKSVTTHGTPFYAGWGLTHDLCAAPKRRTRQCTLDELVAATLILYPRYLDPVTRLPCPAEVLVERMARGEARISSPLVVLREIQGRLHKLWNGLIGMKR